MKKFSLSYRIDRITPAHVSVSVFSAMVLDEYEHVNATRAKSGDLVMRVGEFGPFLEHTRPHVITFSEEAPIEKVIYYTHCEFLEIGDGTTL